ncbi:MAG: hypothetical protein ACTSRS_19265 [Candidatus Helarchaeota archaeon]
MNPKRIQLNFNVSLLLILLTISFSAGTFTFLLNASNASPQPMTLPILTAPNASFKTSDLPSTYPTYSGSGTTRTATEFLWGDLVSLGLPTGGDATNGFDITFDLPGTGYWTGTRLDLTVYDIFEQKDWVSNGDFETGTSPWTLNDDTPGHTGPAITISRPDVGGTHNYAMSFDFTAASTTSDQPPRYTSTNPANEGDVGSDAYGYWSTGGINTGYATTVSAGRVSGQNYPSVSSNRDGAWRMYIYDREQDANDQYVITYWSRYTVPYSEFPVSFANFQFSYRIDASIDNAATANCPDTDTNENYYFYYSVSTPMDSTGDILAASWTGGSGQDVPWTTTPTIDVSDLFDVSFSGDIVIEFKIVSQIDVDDGATWESYDCNHDTWCNYDTCWHCVDNNNEDADSLTIYIDGIELVTQIPEPYGLDVDPDITQTISGFNGRNCTSHSYLTVDYNIPSTFLTGYSFDNNLYLDIVINGKSPHRYSIKNDLTTDGAWHTIILPWASIQSDIGIYPGPSSITIEISIVFGAAGWFAQGIGQSVRIDNAKLWIENYAPADVAQLQCYDVEHGNSVISWDYVTEHEAGFSYTSTWQSITDFSTFWLNTTSTATIWLSSVSATFYADYHYPSVTPSFSLPTDTDGITSTVTWTITHNVQAIASGWYYNLTIPNIPDWTVDDWDVISVKDSLNADVNYQEIPTGGGMKNISISTSTEDATGNWVITCTSPNKITSFDVQNQFSATDYVYYPVTDSSRITFQTATEKSSVPLIFVNYTDPLGNPVDPIYPNTSISSGSTVTMPFWNIPNTAVANDHYVAMVKWIDTDAFNDEVGFAAHYVQIKRNLTVSTIQFEQWDSKSTSNIVVAGEILNISVEVTDPLIDPSLAIDYATLTINYPSKADKDVILQKTLSMTKLGNRYFYLLDTDGTGDDSWLQSDAWMGGVGNRSFTITLASNSTYFNGIFQTYQLTGWFHIVVDTQYDLPYSFYSIEQGLTFTLAVELLDATPAHYPAKSGILYSDLINNRTIGTPITDLDNNGFADTWNGSVFMYWNIIPANLTNWLANNSANINKDTYKWNGSLKLQDGYRNRYEARIRVPFDAIPSLSAGTYYINVTTIILDNQWGWKFETQYMTLTADDGGTIGTYDDHIGCFRLTIVEATGHDTSLSVYPSNMLGSPLEYYWKDPAINFTRLYVRFYNTTNDFGFNSIFLQQVISNGGSWTVESWVTDPKVPHSFGTDSARLQWQLVNSTTLLPDGTPDPNQENLGDNSTWGWFYADFNWTEINLGTGNFISGIQPANFEMYIYAKIDDPTNPYKASDASHYIKVNPNPVNLTIILKYNNATTLLDQSYYPGQMTTDYYWGDILNFTLLAQDEVLNVKSDAIDLRFDIYEQGGGLITSGVIPGKGNGVYSTLLNTSDPSNNMVAGTYYLFFKGLLGNRSINPAVSIDPYIFVLKKRNTQLWPLQIYGVFVVDSVNNYASIDDIQQCRTWRTFDPRFTVQTAPGEIVRFSVYLVDASPRNYTTSNVIMDANVTWKLRNLGAPETEWRLQGWSNTPYSNGTYIFELNLSQMIPAFTPSEYGLTYELHIIPYKPNFDSTEDTSYAQNDPGSAWKQFIKIHKRPIAIVPLKWDYHYSQSNWKYHPIEVAVEDLISGENVSDCQIWWQIGDLQGTKMQEYEDRPGIYYITYDTWPSLFSWISGGQKWLEAQISAGPPGGEYGTYFSENWDIARLAGNFKVSVYVESEGFLGPLTMYFWIIIGVVGAVLGAFYSYKSYKFLTTPYVIRKIDETVDKISKDKKIAAGVMKSRDHLIFLEATDLLKVVGVVLKPPPAKKLPPPIEKAIAPKFTAEEVEKIPEIPVEIISEELDKIGVRPEEKPIIIQQIEELGPQDKAEFVESLIGEERYQQLIEELKSKQPTKQESKNL